MYAVISPSEPAPARALRHTPRTSGVLDAVIERRAKGDVLAHVYACAPLRLMVPRVDADEPLTGIVVNTAGGIVGGDRLRAQVTLGAGSGALLIGQAAEKVYRSAGDDATLACRYRLAAGAVLEVLPQGTILFDGARLRRVTEVGRHPTARLLAGEVLVLGRIGMGETFARGLLHDRWVVACDSGARWIDALRLEADIARLHDAAAGLAGARALATVVYAADDAPACQELARALLAAAPAGVRAAATVVAGVLLVRWLGADPAAVRAALGAFWSAFRAHALGRPARLPVVWHR
ncbi:MAG TPA: urease accessory protein UreD [Alphaproteobacteria bacterium]